VEKASPGLTENARAGCVLLPMQRANVTRETALESCMLMFNFVYAKCVWRPWNKVGVEHDFCNQRKQRRRTLGSSVGSAALDTAATSCTVR
jgi:hypothetical protein